METYLSLGSNLGGRMSNLRSALIALSTGGVRIQKVSPVVESPALLLRGADPTWNTPFLNLVIQADTSLEPSELLALCKQTETDLGRDAQENDKIECRVEARDTKGQVAVSESFSVRVANERDAADQKLAELQEQLGVVELPVAS